MENFSEISMSYYGIAILLIVIIVGIKYNSVHKVQHPKKMLYVDKTGKKIMLPPWWIDIDNTTRKSYNISFDACVNAGVKYEEKTNKHDYINMTKVLIAKGMGFEMAKVIAGSLFPKKKDIIIHDSSPGFPYGHGTVDDNGKWILPEGIVKLQAVRNKVYKLIEELNISTCWSHIDGKLLIEDECRYIGPARRPINPPQ